MIFEPSEKLSRMLAWRDAIHTYYTNTLCELFKTKQFLKCQKLAARLEGRVYGLICLESQIEDPGTIKIHRLHTWSLYCTQRRKDYRFLVEVKPKE